MHLRKEKLITTILSPSVTCSSLSLDLVALALFSISQHYLQQNRYGHIHKYPQDLGFRKTQDTIRHETWYLLQAQQLDTAGKKQEAEEKAVMARNLNIIGLVVGGISAVITVILMFAIIIAART